MANKQDIAGCMSAVEITEKLGMLHHKDNRYLVGACQAKPSPVQGLDPRIGQSLRWLMDSIDADFPSLNLRVAKETEERKIQEMLRREEQKKRAEASKAARLREQAEKEAQEKEMAAAATTSTILTPTAVDQAPPTASGASAHSSYLPDAAQQHNPATDPDPSERSRTGIGWSVPDGAPAVRSPAALEELPRSSPAPLPAQMEPLARAGAVSAAWATPPRGRTGPDRLLSEDQAGGPQGPSADGSERILAVRDT